MGTPHFSVMSSAASNQSRFSKNISQILLMFFGGVVVQLDRQKMEAASSKIRPSLNRPSLIRLDFR
ncbi:hypothetical protein GMES_2950 [Paraglaciecola mesophila KMM 241]|uniref:Uncharacterized protein n=1 Tax=Paraglaciecola mesophila KMM 241 TaxID=1128912 RepID=K6ZPG7_9ALTE|nr:hypothetical protein GMES_2950 [Paraglaciecola mesophila KMM 241]